MASHNNTYFKTEKLNGKREKPWRLRFLKRPLRGLGIDLKNELAAKKWKITTHPTKRAAEIYGNNLIEEALRVNKKARSLPIEDRDRIVELAADLKEKWIDPLEAMTLGAELLKNRSYQNSRSLNDFWDGYSKSRIKNRKWSEKVKRQKEIWQDELKDHFFKRSLSSFQSKTAFAKAISSELKRWMNQEGKKRTARNTLNKHIGNLSAFLKYVTHQADHSFLTPDYLKTLFSEEGRLSVLKLPEGLAEEQANRKLTPAMASVLAREMVALGHPYSTFMILKLFAGQRTEALPNWKWGWIDWNDRKVSIPKRFTKNKTGKVEFGFKNIPNFRLWIEYVYNQMNPSPKPDEKVMTHSQPTLTAAVTKIMNKHPEVFNFPNKGKLNGSTDVRNILRNSFISYGSEKLGAALTQRIVEDKYNLSSYLDSTQDGEGNNAEEFFAITPDSLGLV